MINSAHVYDNILSEYIRKEDREPFGLMVAIPITNIGDSLEFLQPTHNTEGLFISIGISICHHKDVFNKDIAYQVASLKAFDLKTVYQLPLFSHGIHIPSLVNIFTTRCLYYYKDKLILVPKVIYVNA